MSHGKNSGRNTSLNVSRIVSVVQNELRNNGKLQNDRVSGAWRAVRAHWHRRSEISPLPDISHSRLVVNHVYKVILKPIWTYGIQLWGTASNSNLDILERFQSKVLCIITDAPWYVPNAITFKRRIKSHLPFAGIIKSSPYSPRSQDNG